MGKWSHKEKSYTELIEELGLELKSLVSPSVILSIMPFYSTASTDWRCPGKHIFQLYQVCILLVSAYYVSGTVPSTWGEGDKIRCLVYRNLFMVTYPLMGNHHS